MRMHKNLVLKIFILSSLPTIVAQLSLFVAVLVDGIITSRFIGSQAYSAISLLSPALSILTTLAALIAGGCSVLYARYIGESKKQDRTSVYSISLILGLIVCIFYIVIFLNFKPQIFNLCGITYQEYPEMYLYTEQYLYGYIFSTPALVLNSILSPIIIIENNKKLITISSIAMFITDIIFDLLSIFIFNAGLFGIGFASSLACIIQCLILLFHFKTKNCQTKFDLKSVKLKISKDILKIGSSDMVRKLANILRNIIINRTNLSVSETTSTVAARGIQNDINSIMFTFSNGFAKTMMLMSSIFYGNKDSIMLKQLLKSSLQATIITSSLIMFILFMFSQNIVNIYSTDSEVIYYGTFGLKCMAIAVFFDMIAAIMQGYLQGIGQVRILNIYIMFERFIIPVVLSVVLGITYGSLGVLASLAVGKFIQIIILLLIIVIHNKKIPKSYYKFFLLNEEFIEAEKNSITLTINKINQIDSSFNKIEHFCKAHNIKNNKDKYLMLVFEELCINTFNNSKRIINPIFEVCIRVYKDNIYMTIYNNANLFDPVKYFHSHNLKNKYGLKLVFKFTKDVKYTRSFNTNVISIQL